MGETGDVLDSGRAGGLIIRGGALRGLGYVLGLGASLVAAAILFRHLGVADSGRYVTVIAIVGGLGGLTEAGISAVAVREYAVREGEELRRFMANLLGLRWAFGLAGLAAALIFTAAAGYDGEMVAGSLVYGIGLVLFMVQSILMAPLQAQLRLGWVTALEFGRQVAMALAIVVLVAAGAGLVPLLAVPIPATVLMLAIAARLVRGGMPLRPRLDRAIWSKLLRDILPYSAAAVFAVLYLRAIAVVMSLSSTDTETGYYGVAYRVLEALVAIPPLVVSVALPLLARTAKADRDRLRYALDRLFHAALVFGVGTALAVGLAAELAVDVVAGAEFAPAESALRIQAIGLVGSFLIPAWGYGLLSLERHRAILLATGISFVVAVVLAIGLAPSLGADGGSIAVVGAELTLAASYGLLLFGRESDLRTGLGAALRVLLAGAIGLGAGIPLVETSAILAGLAGTGVYALALLVLRALPEELIAAFPLKRPSGPR